MTNKLTKNQQAVLHQLIENKISEMESLISRNENEELKKAENTPPKDVKKIFNEYKKAFDKYLKLEKRMRELEEQVKEKRWYISVYSSKPNLIMHYENPVSRKIMAKAREKKDKLATLKEQLELEITFLNKPLNIVEYLNEIDKKIQDTIK